MNETIEQIEDAILAALEPLKNGEDGITCKLIETFQGNLDAATIEELSERLALTYPSIMVIYLGSRANEDPNLLYHDIQTWGLLVAAENLRGEKDARRGSGANVGTYKMIDAVKKLLTGNGLGLGVQPPSLKAVDSALVGANVSIYSMTFDIDLDYQAEKKDGP
jgi:phage gp37-like protein